MSGPKSAAWVVERNLERERVIVDALREQFGALAIQREEIVQQWKEAQARYGDGFPPVRLRAADSSPGDDSRIQLERTMDTLRNDVHRLQAEYMQAVSHAQLGKTLERLIEASTKAAAEGTTRFARSHATSIDDNLRAARKEEVSGLLARLRPDAASTDRQALEVLVEQLFGAVDNHRFDGLRCQAYLHVQRCNERADAIQCASERAAQLREQLIGLDGDDIGRLDLELTEVEQRKQLLREDIETELNAAVAHATQASDRHYAAGVIADELANLGYHVEEGFETLFVDGGEVYINKPELEEYCIVVHTTPGTDQMDLHLAREAGPNSAEGPVRRQRDVMMEKRFCQDIAVVMESSVKRGLKNRLVARVLEGEHAVPEIGKEDYADREYHSAAVSRQMSRKIDP